MSRKLRIAVIAHGHPDFSLGGGEIAAHNLFRAYSDHPDVESAVFLAGIQRHGQHPSGLISERRPGEYLWDRAMHDWHYFRGMDRVNAHHRFAAWLRMVQPDIVHAHHYAHLGVEIFGVIKRICPRARVFLTLHEFQAICKNNGQMVKTGGTRLCSQETLEDCHRCYPETSREDFWLRKHYLQCHFAVIDGYVAPSDFLRERYIAWGIPEEQITTIENGQIPMEPVPHRSVRAGAPRNRFGFFGQINPFKGVDVLLEAVRIANAKSEVPIHLEINGANLNVQAPDFQEKVEGLRSEFMDTEVVQWNGPYEPQNLPLRLKGIDWVVMPSIWWENSPMVIQEAYMHRRPVIASNIGGMAEKTAAGTSETHVEPRNPLALADTMMTLAGDPALWEENVRRIKTPATNTESAAAHLAWFASQQANSVRRWR